MQKPIFILSPWVRLPRRGLRDYRCPIFLLKASHLQAQASIGLVTSRSDPGRFTSHTVNSFGAIGASRDAAILGATKMKFLCLATTLVLGFGDLAGAASASADEIYARNKFEQPET